MADILVLRRIKTASGDTINRSYPREAAEADVLTHAGIKRVSAGTGALFNDALTTSLTVGGSALTTLNLGIGVAVTAVNIGTDGTAAKTITIGADADDSTTINGNLTVTGNTTTINATNLNVTDALIFLNAGNAAGPGGIAINRTAGVGATDAIILWSESGTRFELGTGDTSEGVTPPAAISSFSDLKLSNLLLAGTTITADAALTVSSTGGTNDLSFGARGQTAVPFNDASNLVFTGAATSVVGAINEAYNAAIGADTWAEVLANGATSGATSPTITSGQALVGAAELTLVSTTTGDVTVDSGTTGAINIGVDATNAKATTIDSGTTGSLNVGTSAFAKTITVGNNTGATTVALNTGSGGLDINADGASSWLFAGNVVASHDVVGAADSATAGDADSWTMNAGSAAGATNPGAAGGTWAVTGGAGGAADAANNAGGIGGAITVASGVGGAGTAGQLGGAGADLFLNAGDNGADGGAGTGVNGRISFKSNGSIYYLTAATVGNGPAIAGASGTTTIVEAINANAAAIGAGSSLQAAYGVGNTIATNVTDGDLAISGTEGFTATMGKNSNLIGLNTTASTNMTVGIKAQNTGAVAGDSTLDLIASSTNGTAVINVTADDTINITTLGSTINIATNAVAQIVNLGTGAATMDINIGSSGNSTAVDVLANAASSFAVTGAGLTISTITSGVLALTSAGILDINSVGALNLDSSAGTINIGTDDVDQAINIGTGLSDRAISIGNTNAGNVSLLTFASLQNSITLNQTADFTVGAVTVDGQALTGFTATSIIGALNELKVITTASGDVKNNYDAAVVFAVGTAAYISANDTVSLATATADNAASRFIGVCETGAAIGAGTADVTSEGLATCLFEAGIATPTVGDEIYLSTVAGRFTNVAPTTAGNVELSVGFLKSTAGLTAGTVGANETAVVQLVRGPKMIV